MASTTADLHPQAHVLNTDKHHNSQLFAEVIGLKVQPELVFVMFSRSGHQALSKVLILLQLPAFQPAFFLFIP